MLESDSSRQLFDPELNQKTDTIFYALGVLQAMQELADHYVFQGEVRGDLVRTTDYTDKNLRQLANFSATTENKYDSAYVYYRVINNCNYFIAHVDTTLRTGADYVMMPEYVAMKSIRAWAYMQLARVYGSVPFYTEPLTQISHIDDGNYPMLDMAGIVRELTPDLEQYAQDKLYNVPIYSGTPSGANFNPSYIFMPVDVVLGEMYLEIGDYDKAANHYIRYLTRLSTSPHSAYVQPFTPLGSMFMDELPTDWSDANLRLNSLAGAQWNTIFTTIGTEYITYIPMAPSALQGATTQLPLTYGYDFYATDKSGRARYIDEVQLQASDAFTKLSSSVPYNYLASVGNRSVIRQIGLGDVRYNSVVSTEVSEETDSMKVWITKFNNARIPLYRISTVMLHLAEAFNRLGMPDAAFAILKDGINPDIVAAGDGRPLYISDETRTALTSTYPILSTENAAVFTGDNTSKRYYHVGIHMHGAGWTSDFDGNTYTPGLSPYQMDDVMASKLAELARLYPEAAIGTTKQDSINAMEDILCDEYALEFAFEGTRFFDLCRMARHKNGHATATSPFDGSPASYGANFGSQWLARKLAYKQPVVNLLDEKNWYLPFK
ncbi:MAG: RagB/SusD family nutrient uptake outer membrane protein [Prevotella sp.]|nr:RagB/SusD family nutrient uptake outer membrane protein [Prevotella sp.]